MNYHPFLLLILTLFTSGLAAQPNQLPASGNVGIGTTNPAAMLQVGSGAASLHAYNGESILFKSGWGDRSLMEIHSPEGGNRFVFQSLNQAFYLASLDQKPLLMQTTGGSVVVGGDIAPAGYKLAVAGPMIAESVTVRLKSNWPDYVFEKSHKRVSLPDLEKYIDVNKHLPEIPSASDVQKNGIDLGEMNTRLLKKIEELTLYIIEQDKQMRVLTEQVNKDKAMTADKIAALEKSLNLITAN